MAVLGRRVTAILIAALVLGTLLLPGAARADSGQDEFNCHVMGTLGLVPGIQALPTSGSIASVGAMDVTCTGVLDGETFDGVAGDLWMSGTYGDGPVSDLSGGATCSHNDGYFDVAMELPLFAGTVTLTEEDYYWQRWAALLIRGDDSFAGAESSQLSGTVTERYGRCTPQEPITGAKIAFDISFAGDIRYSLHPANSAPSAAVSAPQTVGGAAAGDIVATVSDLDGTGDVSAATLMITSGNGQTVGSWDLDAFAIHGSDTLILDLDDHRLLGPAPWTVSLSAVDSMNHSAFDSVIIQRSP